MKRVAALGAAAAVVYVLTVVATSALTRESVRPLFDAVGPAPVYRWVHPPPDFAPGNVRPKPIELPFTLGPDALPPSGASEDSQFVFNLPKGSVPAHGSDNEVIVRIEPTDPDSLGPLPAGSFSDGNAYRLVMRYSPSGEPVTLAAKGSVLLTVPVPAQGLVTSEDGKTWTAVTSQHASTTAMGAELPALGYYLATAPDPIARGGSSGGGGARVVGAILITVGVAAALLMAPRLLRRRR